MKNLPLCLFQIIRKLGAFALLIIFLFYAVVPVHAENLLNLPAPGAMVDVSPRFIPPFLKGMVIHPENPFQIDFIVDPGFSKLQGEALKPESNKLIKYFLTSLTFPDQEQWVNLSPYEKDRLIPRDLSRTELGRDLLAQDYLLKQLMASMLYPEKDLGKAFWNRVYQKAVAKYGTTDLPFNTFNKVWIVPDKAVVYEEGQTVIILESRLKVMLDADYLALEKNLKNTSLGTEQLPPEKTHQVNEVSSGVIKEIVIPEIEKEVNSGRNFALLRQMYNSMILATWYKKKLKNGLLNKNYTDQRKILGVDIKDKSVKEKVYAQYLEAFKKGVYDYIKEDVDPTAKAVIPRKYFSGGFINKIGETLELRNPADTVLKPENTVAQEPGATLELVTTSLQTAKQVLRMSQGVVGARQFEESTFEPLSGKLTFKQAFYTNRSSQNNEPEDIALLTSPLTDSDQEAINDLLTELIKEYPADSTNLSEFSQDVRVVLHNSVELQEGLSVFFVHNHLFVRKEFFFPRNRAYLKEALRYGALRFLGKEDWQIEKLKDQNNLKEFTRQLFNDDLNEMLRQEPIRREIRGVLNGQESPKVVIALDSNEAVVDFEEAGIKFYLAVSGDVTVYYSKEQTTIDLDQKLVKTTKDKLKTILINAMAPDQLDSVNEFVRQLNEYENRQSIVNENNGKTLDKISQELSRLFEVDALELSQAQIAQIRQLIAQLGWSYFYEPKMYDKKFSAKPMETEVNRLKQGQILYIQYEIKDNAGAAIGLTGERVVVVEAPSPQNMDRLVYKKLNNQLASQLIFDIKRVYFLGFDNEVAKLKTDVFKKGDRVVINENGQFSYGVLMAFSEDEQSSVSVLLQTPDGKTDLGMKRDIEFKKQSPEYIVVNKDILSYQKLNSAIGRLWEMFEDAFRSLKSKEPETQANSQIQDFIALFDDAFGSVYKGDDWQKTMNKEYLGMEQKLSGKLNMDLVKIVELMTADTNSDNPLSRTAKYLSGSQKLEMRRLAQAIQFYLNLIKGQKIPQLETTPWMIKEEDFNNVLNNKAGDLDFTIDALVKYFGPGVTGFDNRLALALEIAKIRNLEKLLQTLSALNPDRLRSLTPQATDLAVNQYMSQVDTPVDEWMIRFVFGVETVKADNSESQDSDESIGKFMGQRIVYDNQRSSFDLDTGRIMMVDAKDKNGNSLGNVIYETFQMNQLQTEKTRRLAEKYSLDISKVRVITDASAKKHGTFGLAFQGYLFFRENIFSLPDDVLEVAIYHEVQELTLRPHQEIRAEQKIRFPDADAQLTAYIREQNRKDRVGGIDLNPELLSIESLGKGIDFLASGSFDQLNIVGLTPMIVDVTPIDNLGMVFKSQNSVAFPPAGSR